MSGFPDWNYPAFNAAAAELRAEGHRVYNPAEFAPDERDDFPVRLAFADYALFICMEADTLVLLPGWEHSVGSAAELSLARICNLEVIDYAGWIETPPTSVHP